jgi:hypothetical protein
MTATTTTTTTTDSPTRSPAGIGAVTAVVALAGTVFSAHDWTEIAVVAAVVVVTAALVYGVVAPRALRKESAGGTSLALSIPAVLLLLPAFWSGLPLVLGVAGALVGNAGRSARTGSGQSIAGLVLGALAAVGYLAVYVSDAMNGGAGFLFD